MSGLHSRGLDREGFKSISSFISSTLALGISFSIRVNDTLIAVAGLLAYPVR